VEDRFTRPDVAERTIQLGTEQPRNGSPTARLPLSRNRRPVRAVRLPSSWLLLARCDRQRLRSPGALGASVPMYRQRDGGSSDGPSSWRIPGPRPGGWTKSCVRARGAPQCYGRCAQGRLWVRWCPLVAAGCSRRSRAAVAIQVRSIPVCQRVRGRSRRGPHARMACETAPAAGSRPEHARPLLSRCPVELPLGPCRDRRRPSQCGRSPRWRRPWLQVRPRATRSSPSNALSPGTSTVAR
jgi:hypothetical protein